MSTTEQLPPEPLQSEGAPEGVTPVGPKKPTWLYLVIGFLVAALVAVGLVAFQQHQQVQDRQQALSTAVSQRDQARAQTTALLAKIRRLRAALASSSNTSKGEASEVAKLRAQVKKLQAQLTTMVGPALADGKYFGALYAVGATQDPPKLVIDLEQFFQGAAADQAAKQDGQLPPGEKHVPNDVYIRNDSPQWRILQVAPSTKVSLSTYPFGTADKPQQVSLGRFGKIWNANSHDIQSFPYWITVSDHTVTAIDEQFVP